MNAPSIAPDGAPTTDLVSRLRDIAATECPWYSGDVENAQDALDKAAREIERLRKEARAYREGFEGALRYVVEEVYDDVRAPFDPKGKGFTPEYANDLASMRAARKLLP
jgi:hypothetical protein